MLILYINYVSTDILQSGSSVRPAKILNAFKKSGHEIIVLSGEQFEKCRVQKIKDIEKLLKVRRPDICYIESPTYPIIRHEDRRLIRRLNKMSIPTTYFYRDFYRKFPEQFPRKEGLIGRIKDYCLDILQYLTDRTLRFCDIVYFPSKEATKYFSYSKMEALPPAGEVLYEREKTLTKTGIYVGGVNEPYNIRPLLEAYDELYKHDASFKLILVCRKEEWNKHEERFKNAPWIEVHHLSGDQIIPLYKRSSIGFVMPDPNYSYNNFAVSVKTFEYLSNGLPIIATDCNALSQIINSDYLGITGPCTKDFFIRAIKEYTSSEEKYDEIRTKALDSFESKHLWKHRVNKIIRDSLQYL